MTSTQHLRRLGLVTALAALVAVPANAAGHSKIDRLLRESIARGGATQHVIIMLAPGYRDAVRHAIEQHGDRVKSEFPSIDGLAAEVHTADVSDFAKQPFVRAIAADAPVSATSLFGTTFSWSQTATPADATVTASSTLRQTLGLPRIADNNGPNGSGVTVAVIDSGIAPNADFADRIDGFWDFTNGGVKTQPYDDYGHGTHVAGLIGSSGKLTDYAFQGIAPQVHLLGLKVLDGTGQGTTSDVIAAIEFLIAHESRLNVRIVNLSLGHPIFAPAADDPLVQAVEHASAAGIAVVASAGNNGVNPQTQQVGYGGITSPGNAPSAITVGAVMTENTITRTDDVVAPYSSRGPTWFDAFAKPDVVAPGNKLASDTSLTSYLYKQLKGDRGRSINGQPLLVLSGSSMATAVTTGVAALLEQAHAEDGLHRQQPLTPNLVKAMLEYSALPIAGAGYLAEGAGEINAAGAMALAGSIDTDRKLTTGDWWLRGGIVPSSTIGRQQYEWAQTILWGDTLLGGGLVYTNSPAWSTSIVWGTSDNIVWGTSATIEATNIVWSAGAVWGTDLVYPDRLIGQRVDGGIVWNAAGDDNIVWGTLGDDNIVWGTMIGDNIVWGTWLDDNIVWGTTAAGRVVNGLSIADDNIVWGTFGDDNIVWGTLADDNIVWGTWSDDNIVWGTTASDDIIWGTSDLDNIVWGTVHGTSAGAF